MQQAIPYHTWIHNTTAYRSPVPNSNPEPTNAQIDAKKLAKENAVIVFGRRGCCMGHVVKRLLLGLGVNPAVHEVDEDEELDLIKQLSVSQMVDLNKKSSAYHQLLQTGNDDDMITLPAVFVGGKLFGGLDRVMATHISGELVPVLKRAGALWL